jgi:(p)ppGpp synthase/HD superfamily hydrolase
MHDYDTLLEKAIKIAVQAHEGQKDRYGKPYILHVLRVTFSGKDRKEQICGALHDVVEDSDWTTDDLLKEGFPAEIVEVVRLMTIEKGDDYQQKIDELEGNRLAIQVKLNDLQDNMDLRRYDLLEEQDRHRVNKYLKAWKQLNKNEDFC